MLQLSAGRAAREALQSRHGVAILIHTADMPMARKFWPMVLHGVTKNIAQHAPPGWRVYFANEQEDISCALPALPVEVVHLKTGRRGDQKQGWQASLVEALRQISEPWLIYVQEDAAFPMPEAPSRLQRLQDFAETHGALFIDLQRQDSGIFRPEEVFPQADLGFSLVRNGGGNGDNPYDMYVFNHGVSFSNRTWFLEWVAAKPGEGDPWSAENAECRIPPDVRKRFYYTTYHGGLNETTCDADPPERLNRWGCSVEALDVDGPPIGLDKAVKLAHGGKVIRDYGALCNHTHEQLGLAHLGDGESPLCPPRRAEPDPQEHHGVARGSGGVALLIHTVDLPQARKFWPMVLHGVAKSVALHAPPLWRTYFANEEEDVSCILSSLPVEVVHIRTGYRGASLDEKSHGWHASLLKALKQITEPWLVYIQEDATFPIPEVTARLQRIQDFAEMNGALFIDLMRNQASHFQANETFPQTDLGFSFVRHRRSGQSGHHIFNHGVSFSNRSWFLNWVAEHRGDDGGPWSSESASQWVDQGDLHRFYYTLYDSGLNWTTCDLRPPQKLNVWGCAVEPLRIEGPPLGLDRVVKVGSLGNFPRDHEGLWRRTHELLGIVPPTPQDCERPLCASPSPA